MYKTFYSLDEAQIEPDYEHEVSTAVHSETGYTRADFQNGNFVFVETDPSEDMDTVEGFELIPLAWPMHFLLAFLEIKSKDTAYASELSSDDWEELVEEDLNTDLQDYYAFQVVGDVSPAQLAYVATQLERKPFCTLAIVAQGQIMLDYTGPLLNSEKKLSGAWGVNTRFNESGESYAQILG